MLVVPAIRPVTTPVSEPTDTLAVLLLQVPPVVALVSVTDKPRQTVDGPEMELGMGLTVIGIVA